MTDPGFDVVPPLEVRALSIEDCWDIAMWRAPGPWTVEDSLTAPRPDEGYWAVRDGAGKLVGYCCFGEKARPLGLPVEAGTLDVALGLDPALSGHGVSRLLAAAVIDRALEVADGCRLRSAVASWNAIGRHTAEAAGFRLVGTHDVKGASTAVSYFVYQM